MVGGRRWTCAVAHRALFSGHVSARAPRGSRADRSAARWSQASPVANRTKVLARPTGVERAETALSAKIEHLCWRARQELSARMPEISGYPLRESTLASWPKAPDRRQAGIRVERLPEKRFQGKRRPASRSEAIGVGTPSDPSSTKSFEPLSSGEDRECFVSSTSRADNAWGRLRPRRH